MCGRYQFDIVLGCPAVGILLLLLVIGFDFSRCDTNIDSLVLSGLVLLPYSMHTGGAGRPYTMSLVTCLTTSECL
jgi:hypothetical protein